MRCFNLALALVAFATFTSHTTTKAETQTERDQNRFVVECRIKGNNDDDQILYYPKVTLSDGQETTISDTTHTPFVTGLKRMHVAEKVSFQPLIHVISEGTTATIKLTKLNDELVALDVSIEDARICDVVRTTTVKPRYKYQPKHPLAIKEGPRKGCVEQAIRVPGYPNGDKADQVRAARTTKTRFIQCVKMGEVITATIPRGKDNSKTRHFEIVVTRKGLTKPFWSQRGNDVHNPPSDVGVRRIRHHLQDENIGEPVAKKRADEGSLQIAVHTQLVELAVGKMRVLGLEWNEFDGQAVKYKYAYEKPGTRMFRGTTHDHKQLSGLIEALCQNDLAKVLAEPTLVTLDGRPASFATESKSQNSKEGGFNEQDKVKSERTGTHLDVGPRLLDQDRIRLDLHLEWSGFDRNPNTDNVVAAKVRRHTLDTSIETKLGRTIVLSGFPSESRDAKQIEETILLLLVRPELIAPLPSGRESAANGPIPSSVRR